MPAALGPEPAAPFRICFVCTGNICRSPMAEAVFRDLIRSNGLEDVLQVGSAGTGDWHVGEQADARTLRALAARGYDGSQHRARQFDPAWFPELDLVIAFDRSQRRALDSWIVDDADSGKIQLLLNFDPSRPAALDVPDPYYSDAALFEQVLTSIETACRGLFTQIEPALRKGAA